MAPTMPCICVHASSLLFFFVVDQIETRFVFTREKVVVLSLFCLFWFGMSGRVLLSEYGAVFFSFFTYIIGCFRFFFSLFRMRPSCVDFFVFSLFMWSDGFLHVCVCVRVPQKN